MPLPQSSLNPMCTYPDVLLYILSFPCCRVARILKRCFVCYGRKKGFNHDHRTCFTHKADTEAYKKVHGSKKRAPAGIREAKVEVDKDELAKLMSSVGTELAKEIQEIKRNWVPRSDNKNKENNQNDQNKDKNKTTRKEKRERKKGVNEVDAEETSPTSTTDAP